MVEWGMNRWHSMWRLGLLPGSAGALIFAVVCVAIATGVRAMLGLISPDSAVFAPYYSATLVAALIGGPAAGSLAAALGGSLPIAFSCHRSGILLRSWCSS